MRPRDAISGAAIAAAVLLPTPLSAREVAPTITIAEGGGAVYPAAGGAVVPAAGLRLSTCDVLRTGPQGLVQVEYPDGGRIVLGPDSRLVFDVPRGGDPVVGPHFLLSGWAKLSVPKRDKALAYRIDTPQFGLISGAGIASLHAGSGSGEFFVEQGAAAALVAPAARVAVESGRTFARKAGERGAVTAGAAHAFVQAMPKAFRDTLPSLLEQLKGRTVQPRPARDAQPGDAEQWLRAEPELRACLSDVAVRSAQQVLERLGIDVGPIDGILGPRTQAALRSFQQGKGLAKTGRLDADTQKAIDAVR
ncbi:MAG: peptidoglycan-binding protein [Ideonella sp.]|nr:peptidoglycan-binding protein [Ideonella sp.]MCC7456723.1 peptidoglycan-binding protein [Nitrospira sp.]